MIKLRKNTTLMIVITVVLLFAVLLVPRMGLFLIADDDLEHADAIVVLMGSIADRALEAADLYQGGYAPEIIIGRSFTEGSGELTARGVSIPDPAELTAIAIAELGVPEAALTIMPEQAMSTMEEALIITDYLAEREDIETLIVVTSSYHSKRAKLIFNHALSDLDREVKVYARASRYDSFQPERWWGDRESAKRVVQEYQKIFYFWLWEQFR